MGMQITVVTRRNIKLDIIKDCAAACSAIFGSAARALFRIFQDDRKEISFMPKPKELS